MILLPGGFQFSHSTNKRVDIVLLPGGALILSHNMHAGRNKPLTRMGFNSLTQQVGGNDSPTRMIF